MDVKIAFLNGIIGEEVYIEQPDGFFFPWDKIPCMQIEEILVWTQARTESLVSEDWQLSSEIGIYQE